MKKPNKFIHFCFLINALQTALFIGIFIVLIPIILISQNLGNILFEIIKSDTFSYVFNGLTFFSFINWIFCLRFWYKNDKYSKAIFALFFLHVVYAPFYYYRIFVKKRPLRSELESINEEVNQDNNAVEEKDFEELTRKNIFEILELCSSKDVQLEYQLNVPMADVFSELLCYWNESYCPDREDFNQSFNSDELKLLFEFDKALNSIANKAPEKLSKFIEAEGWKILTNKAIEIKNKLDTVTY